MDPREILKNINPDIRDFAQLETFLQKREMRQFRKSFIEKIVILIISAFGLIAALAWDDACKALFAKLFENLTEFQEKFAYAGIITIIAVVISIVLSKIFLKEEAKSE